MAKLQELPAAVNKTGAQWFKGEIELETNIYSRPTALDFHLFDSNCEKVCRCAAENIF